MYGSRSPPRSTRFVLLVAFEDKFETCCTRTLFSPGFRCSSNHTFLSLFRGFGIDYSETFKWYSPCNVTSDGKLSAVYRSWRHTRMGHFRFRSVGFVSGNKFFLWIFFVYNWHFSLITEISKLEVTFSRTTSLPVETTSNRICDNKIQVLPSDLKTSGFYNNRYSDLCDGQLWRHPSIRVTSLRKFTQYALTFSNRSEKLVFYNNNKTRFIERLENVSFWR